jgi:hypothetical protein
MKVSGTELWDRRCRDWLRLSARSPDKDYGNLNKIRPAAEVLITCCYLIALMTQELQTIQQDRGAYRRAFEERWVMK